MIQCLRFHKEWLFKSVFSLLSFFSFFSFFSFSSLSKRFVIWCISHKVQPTEQATKLMYKKKPGRRNLLKKRSSGVVNIEYLNVALHLL